MEHSNIIHSSYFQLSKEAETEEHTKWLNSSQGHNILALYSNAFPVPKGTWIGVGLVGFNLAGSTPAKVHTYASNLGKEQIFCNGEIEGIAQALEYGARVAEPSQQINAFSDDPQDFFG
jgi:hypothetical protein